MSLKIEPSLQFPAQRENVAEILKAYGIESFEYEPTKYGIENTSLIVLVDQNKFVLRIYRLNDKSDEGIQTEIDFMLAVKQAGIPVPAVLPTLESLSVGRLPIEDKTWRFILMEFITGDTSEHVNDEMLGEFAETQARLHLLGIDFAIARQASHPRSELKSSYFIKYVHGNHYKDQRIADLVGRAKDYRVDLTGLTPAGFIHSDFDPDDNVLVHNNQIAGVLDFGDLQYAPIVVCLADTLLWFFVNDGGRDRAAQYLEVYQRIRPLSERELATVKPIMLYRHYVIACFTLSDKPSSNHVLNRLLEVEAELRSPSVKL